MPRSIQSIERAAAVLRLLAASTEPLPLRRLAQMLDLPKPTLHGILQTLCLVGFVSQVEGGDYRLASGSGSGSAPVDPHLLRSRAVNWGDGLAARTGLAVYLGVPHGASVEVVHHVFRPDHSRQRLRVGGLLPVRTTALGRVLLAYSPVASWDERPGPGVTRGVRGSAYGTSELAGEVRRIHQQGWASVDGRLEEGTAAVAAPIRHHGGVVVGALGVAGPRDRVLAASGTPWPGLPERVVSTARAVSGTLRERL